MNYYSRAALFGLLLMNSSAFSANPVLGWYGGFIAGVSRVPNVSNIIYVDPNLALTANAALSYKVLGGGGGQIGYRWEKFRVEGEVLYNVNYFNQLQLTNLSVGGIPLPDVTFKNSTRTSQPRITGSTYFVAGMFNAFYDFYTRGSDSEWSPYLGLGLGYATAKSHMNFPCNIAQHQLCSLLEVSDSSSAAMGQGIIGVSYWADDFTAVALDFRYMTTNKINLSDNNISSNQYKIQAYTLNLVLNFTFDSDN